MPLQLFKKQSRAPPIDRVKELASHGFSEPEIIDILRKEGYSPNEIDLALSEALKEQIKKASNLEETKKEEKLPTLEEIAQKTQPKIGTNPSQNLQPLQTSQFQDISQYQTQQYSWEDFFNYIDFLIQSRINELRKEMEKINIKYQETEKRINEINFNIREVMGNRDREEKELLAKLDKLSEDIKDLSSRINSLEEIFKEILPALIDSVRSLSRLVESK